MSKAVTTQNKHKVDMNSNSINEPNARPDPNIVVVRLIQLHNNPTSIICPYCRMQVVTYVRRVPNSLATICGCFLCILCLPCCCCALGLIPCLIPSLTDTIHLCPNCLKVIGIYKRS